MGTASLQMVVSINRGAPNIDSQSTITLIGNSQIKVLSFVRFEVFNKFQICLGLGFKV